MTCATGVDFCFDNSPLPHLPLDVSSPLGGLPLGWRSYEELSLVKKGDTNGSWTEVICEDKPRWRVGCSRTTLESTKLTKRSALFTEHKERVLCCVLSHPIIFITTVQKAAVSKCLWNEVVGGGSRPRDWWCRWKSGDNWGDWDVSQPWHPQASEEITFLWNPRKSTPVLTNTNMKSRPLGSVHASLSQQTLGKSTQGGGTGGNVSRVFLCCWVRVEHGLLYANNNGGQRLTKPGYYVLKDKLVWCSSHQFVYSFFFHPLFQWFFFYFFFYWW